VKASITQVFFIFLKLGLYCFGGPIAHLSFFHHAFVEKRGWIDEKTYMEWVALCQSLPGPASSQMAIILGMKQQGLWGGIVAITGFLLPSVAILILAAYLLDVFANTAQLRSLHGIQIAVAAVIAQAILAMGKRFCTGKLEISITVVATLIALAFSTSFLGQIGAIAVGALAGWLLLRHKHTHPLPTAHMSEKLVRLPVAISAWVVFIVLLVALPLINMAWHEGILTLFNRFFQTGSFVFGGGHVVLPLLETQFVTTGLMNSHDFLLGYGIAQAVPGPLFSFAAFIGTLIHGGRFGWLLGIFSVFAIYLPSWLILIGTLPLWERWRHHAAFQAVLAGVCAAVVGLLLAAFYTPIWTDTIHTAADFALTCLAFVLLDYWRCPQWLLVVGAAVIGFII
jgi:chromate transporter